MVWFTPRRATSVLSAPIESTNTHGRITWKGPLDHVVQYMYNLAADLDADMCAFITLIETEMTQNYVKSWLRSSRRVGAAVEEYRIELSMASLWLLSCCRMATIATYEFLRLINFQIVRKQVKGSKIIARTENRNRILCMLRSFPLFWCKSSVLRSAHVRLRSRWKSCYKLC